ncbi:protein kinase, ATP binding site-containing protein, partial [Tanacetum coccineum]
QEGNSQRDSSETNIAETLARISVNGGSSGSKKSPPQLPETVRNQQLDTTRVHRTVMFFNFGVFGGHRKGGFGKVYKGELVHSKGQSVEALKRLDGAFGQGDPKLWKEIIMLSLYRHDNIVSLLGFCDNCGEKILRYALGQHEGLRTFIILVRPNKVLLDENWNARIADLSLSKFGPANQQYTFLVSNGVGTIGYCDPLYVETGLLTKESDVYSFEAFTTIAYQCLNRDQEQPPLMTKVVKVLESALQLQVSIMPPSPSLSPAEPSGLLVLRCQCNKVLLLRISIQLVQF